MFRGQVRALPTLQQHICAKCNEVECVKPRQRTLAMFSRCYATVLCLSRLDPWLTQQNIKHGCLCLSRSGTEISPSLNPVVVFWSPVPLTRRGVGLNCILSFSVAYLHLQVSSFIRCNGVERSTYSTSMLLVCRLRASQASH